MVLWRDFLGDYASLLFGEGVSTAKLGNPSESA